MGIFDLALDSLDDDPFAERPADLKQFLYEDEYLGLRGDGIRLSKEQELLVDLMSQVYRKNDLIRLYGRDRGEEIWSHTKKEIIMMLGKGSGKDFTSTIGCAYLVHKLLCLKEPAKYFGKPPGDAIDILNIAINAQQANNVFFKGFSRAIEKSPWFRGRFVKKAGEFKFDKGVTVHSGHSEREAWEGYNCRTPDVEALTRNGWVTYDRLSVGDEIYTINHETGSGEWHPVERINVFDVVDEPIVEFSGKNFNATSTLDHRWPVVSRSGIRKWKTTQTLNAQDNIPLQARDSGLPVDKTHSNALVEIVAWFMTEGFSDSRHHEIYQSYEINQGNVERIRAALNAEFGPPSGETFLSDRSVPSWREHRNRNLAEFKLNTALWRSFVDPHAPGRVPTYDFMNSLTAEQLELFVETCLLADRRGENEFAQKNFEMAEVFAYACILIGKTVSIREVPVPGRDYNMLNVRIRKRAIANPVNALGQSGSGMERLERSYTGKVWCPTVKNSSWISRERGSVHFTGNCILVILDEIAGFAVDNNTGNENAKTADAVYQMYSQSVLSRFPDVGKVVELSFPRYQGDFITRRYDKVIKEKETIQRQAVIKINEDLPDGIEENEIVVEWDEDHILQYEYPNVFAMRRPSWEVNPTKKISDYLSGFLDDYVDTLSRFACMPPKAVDAFFRSAENVEYCFRNPDYALDEFGRLRPGFDPIDGMEYFIHVDLAQKHDNCAVAMSHISGWGTVEGKKRGVEPKITVDLVRHWKTNSDKPLDLENVRDFILDVWRAGFNIKLVTFDRWNSTQTIEDLKSYGLKAEILSIALPHYMDFLIAVNERRVEGPDIDLLKTEMLQLRLIKANKVDHPRKGSKDLADATCGAIFNAVKYSPRRSGSGQIEVFTGGRSEPQTPPPVSQENVEALPRPPMPKEIRDWLARAQIV